MVKYSITLFVFVFSLLNLAGRELPDSNTGGMNTKGGIKILAIGNSYSHDAMLYMYDLLHQTGVRGDIVLVNAYIVGGSLRQHANNVRTGDYSNLQRQTFRMYDDTEKSPLGTYSLLQLIQQENWDLITLQQASRESGIPASHNEDLDFLIDYVKKHAPNAKLGWHMTWAWAQIHWKNNPSWPDFNMNQLDMYTSICNAVQTMIVPVKAFDYIIPTGTAIQNARGYFGDNLNFDGTHLDNLGCYIAAAMWIKTITGFDVAKLRTPFYMSMTWSPNGPTPYTVRKDALANIVQAVNDAAASPFTTTFGQ